MTEYLENPRRVPRDPVRCRASLVLGTGAIETTTEDIGARGCQVILPQPGPLKRGATVALTLQAPRFPSPLRIEGRVAWVSPQPPFRVGIAYAAGGLPDAARWIESFRQTLPESFVRAKRLDRVAVDAMCFLGVAPAASDFTEDELTVLRTIASGIRVGELRTALSRSWPRMHRAFFALFERGFVTLSRAAGAHPVTWKAILGAPAATPAPGVTMVGDELVLESLLERSVTPPPEPPPAEAPWPSTEPRRGASPTPRRGAPASPSPPPLPRQAPTAPAMPAAQPAAAAPAATPPPLPSFARSPAPAASPRTSPGPAAPPRTSPGPAAPPRATAPALDVTPRRAPAPDFQGAGVGWRNGTRSPRSPEADAVYQLGLVELEGKRAQQALSLFQRALSLAPGDPEIARAIGRAMQGG